MTHHYLCKINILEKYSPETDTKNTECDCDFLSIILSEESNV